MVEVGEEVVWSMIVLTYFSWRDVSRKGSPCTIENFVPGMACTVEDGWKIRSGNRRSFQNLLRISQRRVWLRCKRLFNCVKRSDLHDV